MVVEKWEVEVSLPYPCWVRILYEGQEIRGIHHKDLRDLEYALGKAMKEVRDKLPEGDKTEIDRAV
jgi:hypothetical protein